MQVRGPCNINPQSPSFSFEVHNSLRINTFKPLRTERRERGRQQRLAEQRLAEQQ